MLTVETNHSKFECSYGFTAGIQQVIASIVYLLVGLYEVPIPWYGNWYLRILYINKLSFQTSVIERNTPEMNELDSGTILSKI